MGKSDLLLRLENKIMPLTKGRKREYLTTHPGLEVWPDEEPVTIGIGCICEQGEAIVLASDLRATYGTTPIGPHDHCGKLFNVNRRFPIMAIFAGRMSECHAVISQLVYSMRRCHLWKNIPREAVMQEIDNARSRELVKIYDWTLKTKMGISLQEWSKGNVRGGMDKLVLRAGLSFMQDAPFKVGLIVAGYMRGQTMFFRGVHKERLQEETSPGVYVIGSGQIHAMDALNRRTQSTYMSLARTLLHVHEAMLAARREKTVGSADGYIVMKKRERRVLFLPASSATLENWTKHYAGRSNTGSLDDSKVAAMEIYHQLKVLHPTRSGVNR